ncbi:hypothetical protein PR048_029689 [Dryococelus australis]|uniref:Uncharacterized protein n=1 Tax=Dryococelus australis TaxID=614101 RepID=A0ABQ9GE42_9NEOP|nr:hypothetical protein PR048_029689 [Dryococelus australis]
MRKPDNVYTRYKPMSPWAADSLVEQYRMLRNKCAQLVRRAEMLYSLDSFRSCRTSGDFWKGIASFFPTSWRYAVVKPFAKCISATALDDFRPI